MCEGDVVAQGEMGHNRQHHQKHNTNIMVQITQDEVGSVVKRTYDANCRVACGVAYMHSRMMKYDRGRRINELK